MASTLVHIIFLLFTLGIGQNETPQWPDDSQFTAADKKAILSLAGKLGIRRVGKIVKGVSLPDGCQFAVVQSPVVQDGYRLRWAEVWLTNRTQSFCKGLRASKREGQWISLADKAQSREMWRVEDEDWHLDLNIGSDIPYSDVESIVRAVRRDEMVNKLLTSFCLSPELKEVEPDFDANTITSISKSWLPVAKYQVTTGAGGGMMLYVSVVNGEVELWECTPYFV